MSPPPDIILMTVGIDNITPGTSTSSSLSVGSMRPYLQDLLLGLPALFPDWHFKLFTPSWNEPFEIRLSNVDVVECREASRSPVKRAWYEQTGLPRRIAAEKVDLWLATCNYLPLLARCKTLLIVQSHQCFTNPEAFRPLRRFFLQWVVTRSVELADRTVVQSEDAKRTLRKFIAVPEASVSVIYNRLAEITGPEIPSRFSRPYLLYVSAFYLFKNHPRLIEAFARIHSRFPELTLVLAGGDADGRTAAHLKAIAARHGVADHVIILGKVPRQALPELYRNARASVFLSLEETFGLPVLEAMAFDCPVLTSNRSSMAEIAGDAALLADPESIDAIVAGMTEILSNASLRHELKQKGRHRSTLFTKEQTIQNIANALTTLTG